MTMEHEIRTVSLSNGFVLRRRGGRYGLVPRRTYGIPHRWVTLGMVGGAPSLTLDQLIDILPAFLDDLERQAREGFQSIPCFLDAS